MQLKILDATVAVCSLFSDNYILFVLRRKSFNSSAFFFLYARDIFLANLYLELRLLNVISCYINTSYNFGRSLCYGRGGTCRHSVLSRLPRTVRAEIFVLSTCQMSLIAYQMLNLSVKAGSHFLGTIYTTTTNRNRGHLSWKKWFKVSGAFGTDGETVFERIRFNFWCVIS